MTVVFIISVPSYASTNWGQAKFLHVNTTALLPPRATSTTMHTSYKPSAKLSSRMGIVIYNLFVYNVFIVAEGLLQG